MTTPAEMSRVLGRVLFLAALGGGLLFWSHLRRPRELTVEIDLTEALPGDVVEADVVVRRGGRALARHEIRYGPSGAPGVLQLPVRAAPGDVDVEVTLVQSRGASRRTESRLRLGADAPGRMSVR